jgi:hypothetical protein
MVKTFVVIGGQEEGEKWKSGKGVRFFFLFWGVVENGVRWVLTRILWSSKTDTHTWWMEDRIQVHNLDN